MFCVLDICVLTACCKFSLLQREYVSSAVNVLTNSSKILDINKGDIFKLYLPQSDGKI